MGVGREWTLVISSDCLCLCVVAGQRERSDQQVLGERVFGLFAGEVVRPDALLQENAAARGKGNKENDKKEWCNGIGV